jgi:hypothetical protein
VSTAGEAEEPATRRNGDGATHGLQEVAIRPIIGVTGCIVQSDSLARGPGRYERMLAWPVAEGTAGQAHDAPALQAEASRNHVDAGEVLGERVDDEGWRGGDENEAGTGGAEGVEVVDDASKEARLDVVDEAVVGHAFEVDQGEAGEDGEAGAEEAGVVEGTGAMAKAVPGGPSVGASADVAEADESSGEEEGRGAREEGAIDIEEDDAREGIELRPAGESLGICGGVG